MQWTYKDAGVDVHAGYEAVRRMSAHAKATQTPGVLGGLGGFGGMFRLPEGYREPVLIAGTDGVGTKLRLAFDTGVHTTVGVDCVAMCVNDIACQGAKPLFFLDYIGTGVLDPEQAAQIVEGISAGCIQAGCALIGGETAEMPGFYRNGEYDVAGFAVGIAEREQIITGRDIAPGDVLIGISSSGVHSNGFSLVRRLTEAMGYSYDRYIPELEAELGQALLTPTKIYVPLLQSLIQRFTIKGAAHITGGGWFENIPRMFPGRNLRAVVKKAPAHAIFKLLQQWGQVEEREMYSTFNMGIGLVLAVAPEYGDSLCQEARVMGEEAYFLGTVEETAGEERVVIV